MSFSTPISRLGILVFPEGHHRALFTCFIVSFFDEMMRLQHFDVCGCLLITYLRAAAPAADPGKEKLAMVSAGFIRVFCELSAWMLYIYIIYICIK